MTEVSSFETQEDGSRQLPDLVARAQAGDEVAFELIYSRLAKPLYRFLYIRVGNQEDAEDLLQTVFTKIWNQLSSFQSPGSFMAWVYTVARNTVIDFYRKKRDVRTDMDLLAETLAGDLEATETAEEREYKVLISSMLKDLSPDQREVLTLRFMDDLSTEEICTIVDKQPDAVRQLQSRALRLLRERFNESNPWNTN